jgi:protease-4
VQTVYELFLDRVAEGRSLEPSQVHRVARGRVWTGEQAVERGLVDQLGGLRAAVGLAKDRAGIDADADVGLTVYPPPRPLAEHIAESFRLSVAQAAASALPFEIQRWPPAAGRISAWLGAVAQGGALLWPPVWIEIQ